MLVRQQVEIQKMSRQITSQLQIAVMEERPAYGRIIQRYPGRVAPNPAKGIASRSFEQEAAVRQMQ